MPVRRSTQAKRKDVPVGHKKKRTLRATERETTSATKKRNKLLRRPKELDFINVLQERGFIYQCTDTEGLRDAANARGLVGYIGFDCTAPSLHVGSLVQIMLLRWLQKTGGKPIVLMGGGTTRIGDPSDKDAERPFLTPSTITSYKRKIRSVFDKFLEFNDGPTGAVMEDNAHWLGKLRYLKFLREVGRHFTVNRMLALESVKRRLEREQPLTFMEFNYPLLQAADFLTLSRKYNCRLQMGGSDQWGNIIQGVELCRRVSGVECYGLTSPLITTSSGSKMGKTAEGAVWLSPEFLPPFRYWQFWRNTEDRDVGRFLKLFTDLPLDEITRLETLQGAEINDAKRVLATEATALLHGREAAEEAAKTSNTVFANLNASIGDMTLSASATIGGLPTFAVTQAELAAGLRVAAAFVRAGLVASNGEAKRHIAAGALRINDVAVSDENAVLGATDVTNGAIKLSLGKKKHALLKLS